MVRSAAPAEQMYKGMERYWRKRAEALNGPAACAARGGILTGV